MNRLLRRHLTALCLCLIAAATLSAQRSIDPKVYIGIKGGATLSSMQFSPAVKQSLLPGTLGGLSVRYTEEKLFGLLAELTLDGRGWAENFEELSDRFSYHRQLNYIQMPVMTHIYFGSQHIKGFVNLGPSVGYMLSSKIKANFDYNDIPSVEGFPSRLRRTEQLSLPIKNKFDYGICAGLGMEFCIDSRNSFMLEGRYYFGLGSIFSSRKADTFSSSRGTSIQISLGYMYRISR